MNGNGKISIAVSGLPGAGKTELGRKLAEHFGLRYLSAGEILRQRFETWSEESELRGSIPFEEYWRTYADAQEIIEVNKLVANELARGGIVAASRYAPVNCLGLDVPKVFLTAPLDIRVERALSDNRYLGRTPDQIRRTLIHKEADEVARGRDLFGDLFESGFDYRDSRFYDLIIDARITPAEQAVLSAAKIVRAVVRP